MNMTQTAEIAIRTSNRMMASVIWQLVTRPTATRGHIMPPTFPAAFAAPAPVALTDVGYN